MSVTGRVARTVLGLAFLACSGVVAAQIPAQFRIVRHVLVVDVPRREAVFNLWFSETPDLATFDQFGRQSHAFQYFLELPDHRNFGRHLRGLPRLEYPLITALSGEVATGDRVVARVITPGTTDSWGPLAATADIQQLRSRVSFRLPLSIFDSGTTRPYEGNEQFAVHYFLQALRFGRTTYYLARGAATVGTVDAKLRVHRREVRTSNGSTRVLLIAQVLAHPSTEEEPFIFLPEFADVASVRFGPNRARPIGNELRDVNGDRSNDLVLTFNATDVGLSCIDTYVTITGEIPDPGNFVPEGTVFIGRAARTPQPC